MPAERMVVDWKLQDRAQNTSGVPVNLKYEAFKDAIPDCSSLDEFMNRP